MAISARCLRVGEATFDLDARTVVVATVARPRLEARLAEIDDTGADVVLVTPLLVEAAALGATVERIRSRTRLPVVVEVTDAARVTIALGAGAGGVAAPEAVVDDAYREALAEGDGSLFVRAAPRSAGFGSVADHSGPADGAASGRVAIEPGPLSAAAIATFAAPLDGDEILILSTSEQDAWCRYAAIALGVGRGWPVVRVEAPAPGDVDGTGGLIAAVRAIRMIDAIRTAETTHLDGDAP